MAVTPAGGVVLSGNVTVPGAEDIGCLVALTPAGHLDPAFNAGAGYLLTDLDGPGAVTQLNDVAVQGTGIVVAAYSRVPGVSGQGVVARYTLSGTLDAAFGTGGRYVSSDLRSSFDRLEVAADGSIIVAGSTSAVQPDGSLLSRTLVGRLTAAGALDTSFGPGGVGFTYVTPPVGVIGSLSLGPDGSILLSNNDYRSAWFARFTAP
jgi:uncharacterized delta-60 repeat protein